MNQLTLEQIEHAISTASEWFEPLEAETYVVQEYIDRLRQALKEELSK